MFMMKFKAVRLELMGGIRGTVTRNYIFTWPLKDAHGRMEFDAIPESNETHEQSPLNKLDEDKENATKASTRWGEKVK